MSRIENRDRRRRTRGSSQATSPTSTIAGRENYSNPYPDSFDYRFYCQLAHGSPTGIIEGFRTVRELHAKIAECFDMDPSEIMYCTLNTHKVDVEKILGHELGLNDFIFAHVRGQPKEITIKKESDSFGMTLSDNGCGVVYIKRIQSSGQMAHKNDCCGGMIFVGDQIERINNISFVGRRHYDVAAYLKSIPLGFDYVLRLISPLKSPIYMFNSRSVPNIHASYLWNGMRTIRLNENDRFREYTVVGRELEGTRRVNDLLGCTLGFEDDRLANLIYRTAVKTPNPQALVATLYKEQLLFNIPTQVMHEAWSLVRQPCTTQIEMAMDNLPTRTGRLKQRH